MERNKSQLDMTDLELLQLIQNYSIANRDRGGVTKCKIIYIYFFVKSSLSKIDPSIHMAQQTTM